MQSPLRRTLRDAFPKDLFGFDGFQSASGYFAQKQVSFGLVRELLQYFLDNGAYDAETAINLAGVDVRPSILASMLSRNIVKRTASGEYFVDRSRTHEAYGASNRFILYAMGAFILVFLVIMLW